MTLAKYLQLVIRLKLYTQFNWILSAFAVTRETEEQAKRSYPGKIIREPFGFFVIDEHGEKVKLETSKKLDQPLFDKYDKITIGQETLPIIEGQIETTLGLILLNAVALYESFGTKIAYINNPFTPQSIEKIVAPLLRSYDPGEKNRDEKAFYVDELEKFSKAVLFLETLSPIFCSSITRAGLLPAPGRKEFKKELLKKYEGKLEDPVEMAKFEGELKKFDETYLQANDEAYGKFMGGKVKASRMKSYMTQGGETNDFVGSMKVTPIVQALEDGIPLDPDGFTAISNTIRYGSFSRGAETVNGGVVAKSLMRAADNWKITQGDCGSKLGISRSYNEKEIDLLVGRSYIKEGKAVLINSIDEAKPFINRKIVLRSPQYCRRPGTQTCEVCAGKALSKYPTGLPIPLMEVSGGILADSLKKMHNTALSTAVLHLRNALS